MGAESAMEAGESVRDAEMSALVVTVNDFVFENAWGAEGSGLRCEELQLGVAAVEGEESLPALRTFAPERAHETERGMTYCRERLAQRDVPALVMAIEPGRRTYFHVAWAQVDDPACTMEMVHGMEPGTYYRVKQSQNDPALAAEMARSMEPGKMEYVRVAPWRMNDLALAMAMELGKMAYCHVAPWRMNDLALVMAMEPGKMTYDHVAPWRMNDLALAMAMEPGKMTYYHVALLQVGDHPYTLEMALAMVSDRMTYSHGGW